jgi:LAO/AO transport system kinase
MRRIKKRRLEPQQYIDGVMAGDRMILSRAITLMESSLPADHMLAMQVLDAVLPYTGKSLRIGITGVPGVGKSTFIEGFGKYVTGQGKKLAVLAIDPSSQRSGGSILGDKTRMEELSHDPFAFIRPSAAGASLGGVGAKTRESMLLCEAAGFEVIFIETVGVGQSETAVRNMVDFFLLLMLAGAGDELQGIKKGIMEMADAIAITKADGENRQQAQKAMAEYQNALHLFPVAESGWQPRVLTCSAVEATGFDDIWQMLEEYQRHSTSNGFFQQQRQSQNLSWMHTTIDYLLKQAFYTDAQVSRHIEEMEQEVMEGRSAALSAARKLFELYSKG